MVNEDFIAYRVRIGHLGTWGGLGLLLASVFASFRVTESLLWTYLAYGALLLGLVAYNVGRRNALRWDRRPREDEVLAAALRGLDHRHRLLNYLPTAPAPHILITPNSLIVLETRHHMGRIAVQGDRWQRKSPFLVFFAFLAEGPLGNPIQDAQRAVALTRQHLAQHLPPEEASAIPIEALVVFVSPRVTLEVSQPTAPVLTPRELKPWLRKQPIKAKLGPTLLQKLYEAFE